MIVKIGNRTFNSNREPIAIILDEGEKNIISNDPPLEKKPGTPFLFCWWPSDIPYPVVSHWLTENVPEMKLNKIQVYHRPVPPETTPT
jgi:hypothetical protein